MTDRDKAHVGLIGMAVMGRNLAFNLTDHGRHVGPHPPADEHGPDVPRAVARELRALFADTGNPERLPGPGPDAGRPRGSRPEPSGVLDWLQDTSTRRLSLSATRLARPGFQVPRYSDLLRNAYSGAKPAKQ